MDELGNHAVPRGSQPGAADRLRELLVRAAQDQANGQRSSSSALEEIRQRMDGLAAAVAALAQKVGALDTRLERLDERHDDQYDRLTSLEDTLLLLAEALLCPSEARGPERSGAEVRGRPEGRRVPEGRVPETRGRHLSEPERVPGVVPERVVPERVVPERAVPERVVPERVVPERVAGVVPERVAGPVKPEEVRRAELYAGNGNRPGEPQGRLEGSA
jgi:hypothetical protein